MIPPWVGKHSRFTRVFEAIAIEVLQACQNFKAAVAILGLSSDSLQTVMNRAVKRGLEPRETTSIPHLGIDEKSFGRGPDSFTVLTDLDRLSRF